jgi:hypothetical protein
MGQAVPVDIRLSFWPQYAAVARLVRYDEVPYGLLKPELDKLGEQSGHGKVREAFGDVCERDRTRTCVLVRLRPKVREACFVVAGSSPVALAYLAMTYVNSSTGLSSPLSENVSSIASVETAN